ncbi:FAD-binding protein [uncultured Paracoccus sp.]|uniref:FAD-binding protein n=1 Tax=uncultured Paracoccus sp. TaxID=189685 RepID=UPI00262CC38F|nr:FAD-binding protein [uncultured Paracoccus sp.]
MRPETESELASLIRGARTRLTPVGGATRLLPGEGQGDRLSCVGLTGITLYEPAALTVVARAGTQLAELNATLAAEHQRLAFEPDEAEGSTIGGVIAANASGPRRVKDGAARDSLLGVRFVDGQGEVVRNGGRVMKNVTGYDLVKLMAGSRGTLGVLTEVSLKTQPIPPCVVTLILAGLAPDQAVDAMTAALTGPWDVTGAGRLPGGDTVLRLEGLEGSVRIRTETLVRRLGVFGTVEVADGDAAFVALRQVRREMIAAAGDGQGNNGEGGRAVWRIVCRPSQAPAVLHGLPGRSAVDWGGALIWAVSPRGWVPDLPQGAFATRVHGGPPLTVPLPAAAIARLNDGLRAQFDPRSILAGAGVERIAGAGS